MAAVLIQYGHPQRQFYNLAKHPLSETRIVGKVLPEARTIAELTPEDDLLFPMSSRGLTASLRNVKCRVSLVMIEPPAIQMRYYRMMPLLGLRYHRIFTYSEELNRRLKNAVYLPHGGTSITAPAPASIQKTQLVSMIASQKRVTPGHRLRHRVAAWAQSSGYQLELFGRGYRPVESVTTALSPFRYSVVIENSRFPHYFTEKLIDCLLCRTIPIYWGDPEISHQFNPAGIIVCRTEADLYHRLTQCSPQDYQERVAAVEENAARAMQLAVSPMQRAARHLLRESLGSSERSRLADAPGGILTSV